MHNTPMLITRVIAGALVLLASRAVWAADYAYGSAAELKGITKIYVDAEDAVDLRNIMTRVIEKRLPKVEVLPSEDGAELVLLFSFQQLGRKAFVGELLAVKPTTPPRLLAKYRHDEEELNDLADEIVKKFIKEYSRENR
jgi:hypothetical protein